MDNAEPVGEAWQYEPDYHRVSDYLGVDTHDRQDYKTAQKVSVLRAWAAENGANSLESTMAAMQDLRKKVGTQSQGKTLINELYQHLRFQSKPTSQKAQPSKKPAQKKSPAKAESLEKVVQKSVEGRIAEIISKQMGRNIQYRVDQIVRRAIK